MRTNKIKIHLVLLMMCGSLLVGCISLDGETSTGESSSEKTDLIVAFSIKDDYTEPAENPQAFADFLAVKTGLTVTLYDVGSEGAILEALRFGHADIAFMDGGAAWVGWQEYGLAAMAADQKSDGRTYYEAHAWVKNDSEMAEALYDDNESTDPFAFLAGKTSCHTGWLKSAGMLLPMGYLIANNYATVQGSNDDIESLRATIFNHFSEDASIPDKDTAYYGYSGAVKCLSEGVGHVAFAKDSTVDSYCANTDSSENEEWCLDRSAYVKLPAFGKAPSHPVMYNPSKMSDATKAIVLDALLALNQESWVVDEDGVGTCVDSQEKEIHSEEIACGSTILDKVLNTPGLVGVTTEEHLGSYSSLISSVPGISTYYDIKYEIAA